MNLSKMLLVKYHMMFPPLKLDIVPFDQQWPHASYPPWAHGPGYVISRDIAKFIVHGHEQGKLKVRNSNFAL